MKYLLCFQNKCGQLDVQFLFDSHLCDIKVIMLELGRYQVTYLQRVLFFLGRVRKQLVLDDSYIFEVAFHKRKQR